MRTTHYEFRVPVYDPRTKDTGRLLTVESLADGNIRVIIQAENPISNNLGYVTLSDETMSAEIFDKHIKPTLQELKLLTISAE